MIANNNGNKSSEGSSHDGVSRRDKRLFHNQLPDRLAGELEEAQRLGIKPLKFGEPGFDEVVNAGRVKWAVTETGELVVIPHTTRATEIAHAVLTGGGPVLAAGEAEIAVAEGCYFGIEITNRSGHFMPSTSSLEIGRAAFRAHGIIFP